MTVEGIVGVTRGPRLPGRLLELKQDANYQRPSMFTIFGEDEHGESFILWGMEFQNDDAERTVLSDGENEHTWHEADARTLLAGYREKGDAYLQWLE
jgi:hypothetical protein